MGTSLQIWHVPECENQCGDVVASWLVHSFLDLGVLVQVLVGDIVFCSWERQFTLTVPFFTQGYKWVNQRTESNPVMD